MICIGSFARKKNKKASNVRRLRPIQMLKLTNLLECFRIPGMIFSLLDKYKQNPWHNSSNKTILETFETIFFGFCKLKYLFHLFNKSNKSIGLQFMFSWKSENTSPYTKVYIYSPEVKSQEGYIHMSVICRPNISR